MFCSLFECLQKTIKPSHEKTQKGHVTHKSIEMIEFEMFLKCFLLTSCRPPKKHAAQPRTNLKRAPEPQKHRNAKSWHVFERFSGHFLKASTKPWSTATKKQQKGTWATKASKYYKLTCLSKVFWFFLEAPKKPWSPATKKHQKGTWTTKASKCSKLTCFWKVFWSLFGGLQKTMKPSHEKTPKGHLNHKSIEMLEVKLFLIGFLLTFWRPPKNQKAQPQKNTKRVRDPQKHWNDRSWNVFEMFSAHFL